LFSEKTLETTGTTPPKFNIAPEKRWFEDYFPFGMAYFQGRTVKLPGGKPGHHQAAFFWHPNMICEISSYGPKSVETV